jgi:hypothetical protein
VPADSSSWIPLAVTQLTRADPLQPTEAPDLLGYLATIHDPRSPATIAHSLSGTRSSARVVMARDYSRSTPGRSEMRS